MGRFLLDFAGVDLRAAELMLQDTDDFALRIAAYHVEQAIEKIIKQILTECGVNFGHNHKFREILSALPDSQSYLSVDALDFLSDNADRLTNWVTQLKYVRSYITTRRETLRMYEFATKLFNEVSASISVMYNGMPKRPIPDSNGLQKMKLGG